MKPAVCVLFTLLVYAVCGSKLRGNSILLPTITEWTPKTHWMYFDEEREQVTHGMIVWVVPAFKPDGTLSLWYPLNTRQPVQTFIQANKLKPLMALPSVEELKTSTTCENMLKADSLYEVFSLICKFRPR